MPNLSKQDENDGIHIDRVLSSVPCPRHGADIGHACWNLLSINGILKAICNNRALEAGCRGEITPAGRGERPTPPQKKVHSR